MSKSEYEIIISSSDWLINQGETSPTPNMELSAKRQGRFEYKYDGGLSSKYFDTVQILTAQEIIDGRGFDLLPTMMAVKEYRNNNKQLLRQ